MNTNFKFINNEDTCAIPDDNIYANEDKANEIKCNQSINSESFRDLGLRLLSHLYLALESKYFVTKSALQRVVNSFTDLNTLNITFIKTETG